MNGLSKRVPVIPSAAAERMRRHRQRRREGLTHIGIDLRRSEIDGLVRLGFLSAETRNDVTAIERVYTDISKQCSSPNRDAQQG